MPVGAWVGLACGGLMAQRMGQCHSCSVLSACGTVPSPAAGSPSKNHLSALGKDEAGFYASTKAVLCTCTRTCAFLQHRRT